MWTVIRSTNPQIIRFVLTSVHIAIVSDRRTVNAHCEDIKTVLKAIKLQCQKKTLKILHLDTSVTVLVSPHH